MLNLFQQPVEYEEILNQVQDDRRLGDDTSKSL